MNQVEELEHAILARAERLAVQYRERAGRRRDSILRESSERLKLQEAREETLAKSLAERIFRQRVQAGELTMQAQLDQLRWELVQNVENQLLERMQAFLKDVPTYATWLIRLITEAAHQIEAKSLVVTVNAADQALIQKNLSQITANLPNEKTLEIAAESIPVLGGAIIASSDQRIRIDQTYEGRLARLRLKIQQTILDRLLAGSLETSSLFTG